MPLAGYMVFKHPDQFSLIGVGVAGAVGCVIGSAAAYGIGAAGGRPLLLKYGKYILISKATPTEPTAGFSAMVLR